MYQEIMEKSPIPIQHYDKTMISQESPDKIYCANCQHCKLIRSQKAGSNDEYQLRVRCDAGKWKKKLGDEKFYKYFTVARRSIPNCDFYDPMGETKAFLKELRKTLPIKDEVYIA